MKKLILTALLCVSAFIATAQSKTVTNKFVVNADSVKAHVQPTMYGIFFEDINMAADGGLYAELVKNRSFEFVPSLIGWKEQSVLNGKGALKVIDRLRDRPENPHYLQLSVSSNTGSFGLSNEGFRGMGIKQGEGYIFSIYARQHAGSNLQLQIQLSNEQGKSIGNTVLSPVGQQWVKYTVKFKATATTEKASLRVLAKNKGDIDLDMISLFPEHTWKNRSNGLRTDLVQKLYDMKPGFLRFPGGCIVEGRELANRYQWKKTIGDVDKRETIINRWNLEFKHRPTPDYYQSFGLGFMEYFMLAEDIGAEPLPILNCGMACQFNTGQLAPLDALDPYIQDALDLVEFANGSPDTKWGKLRVSLGHPASFNLKMIGVGNEQWGDQYIERWKIFEKALKGKYPYIKLVSSVGPDPDGAKFNFLSKTFKGLHADILDEHYYRSPQWFLDNVKRYDNYDRSGPKIFAGEYAAQSVGIASPDNKNNWQCAMSEAAFMTGLERNADVVNMASYAPLFAHVDAWQWTPDLIWFNNLKSYGTPNYYVQQLYSLNKGTDVVPVTLNSQTVTGQGGLFASSVLDKKRGIIIVKIINTNNKEQQSEIFVDGKKVIDPNGILITLHSDDLTTVNSITNPKNIAPINSGIVYKQGKVILKLQPYSFNIIQLKYKD